MCDAATTSKAVDTLGHGDDHGGSIVEAEAQEFRLWQDRVKNTNISGATLLATDYLNHFNEITMLIDMVPDTPSFLDECRKWQPKSYTEHFRTSDFADRELAIAAYEHSPAIYRHKLEETISFMNSAVEWGLEQLSEAIEQKEFDLLRIHAHATGKTLRRLNEVASGIIHGTCKTSGTLNAITQSDIDFKWRNSFIRAAE